MLREPNGVIGNVFFGITCHVITFCLGRQ
jgi:hypothetical protein